MDTCSTIEILFFMSTVGNGHHVQKEPIDLYKKTVDVNALRQVYTMLCNHDLEQVQSRPKQMYY